LLPQRVVSDAKMLLYPGESQVPEDPPESEGLGRRPLYCCSPSCLLARSVPLVEKGRKADPSEVPALEEHRTGYKSKHIPAFSSLWWIEKIHRELSALPEHRPFCPLPQLLCTHCFQFQVSSALFSLV